MCAFVAFMMTMHGGDREFLQVRARMQCTECLNTVQDERILSSPGITGVSNDTGIPGFCSSFIRRCPKCGDLARSLEKPCGPLERGGHPMRQTECFCRRAAPLTAALPPSLPSLAMVILQSSYVSYQEGEGREGDLLASFPMAPLSSMPDTYYIGR